jgi:TPR repeat protein
MSRLQAGRALALALLLPALAVAQPAAKSPAKKAPDVKAAARKAESAKAEPAWLTSRQALARYQEALKADGDGHHRHAFVAYLEAAENGHGHAQKKMGDIYSRNGPVVKRDYETALRWYEKARAQGIPIPKPPSFTKGH